MSPALQTNLIVLFVLLVSVTIVKSKVEKVIPLNKTLTQDDKELFGEIVTLKNGSILHLLFTNVSKEVDFIIVQAHSHIYDITLYTNTTSEPIPESITGKNLGLYGTLKPPSEYYILNENGIDLNVYISVHGYKVVDPIPGGCNMESPINISPFMNVQYTKDIIHVDAPAPQAPHDTDCIRTGELLNVEFYRMYLEERDFSEETYFAGLKNMLTLGKIKENGIQMRETTIEKQRRYLSAYPGTGSVYVAVAYKLSLNGPPTRYSVYVPIYTYACSPLDGCEILDDFVSQFLCAGLIFIGLFACFLGHRFFKTEMFLVGTFAGIIITYILLCIWTDMERPALLGASLMTGTFFGAIWILLWWFYGIPVLSVSLATMHFGFIVAAIVYHLAPGGNELFKDDGRFWTVFILVMLCLSVTLTTVSYLSNIVCCAVLGAYAVVFSMDHYVGSNLKYLVYNTVRRAVVPKFYNTILALPYQWRDAILTVLWLGLAVSGFLFQHYHNRGRSPFPPPPRSINLVTEPMVYGAIENRGRRRFWQRPNGVDRSAITADERTSLLEET